MQKPRLRNHYRLDKNRDGTYTLSRATEYPHGWMEKGSKIITDLDSVRSKLIEGGFTRSFPPSYGGNDVLEYWDEPK